MENFDLKKYLNVEESPAFTSEMFLANVKCYKIIDDDIYFAEWDFHRNQPLKVDDNYLCAYYAKDGKRFQSIVSKDFIQQAGPKAYDYFKTELDRAIENIK